MLVPAAEEDYVERPHDPLAPELAEALGQVRPATRVASICAAVFVLAALGWSDGYRVTTH